MANIRNFSKLKCDAMDKMTLIAASVPVLLLLGMIGYMLYNWKKGKSVLGE